MLSSALETVLPTFQTAEVRQGVAWSPALALSYTSFHRPRGACSPVRADSVFCSSLPWCRYPRGGGRSEGGELGALSKRSLSALPGAQETRASTGWR